MVIGVPLRAAVALGTIRHMRVSEPEAVVVVGTLGTPTGRASDVEADARKEDAPGLCYSAIDINNGEGMPKMLRGETLMEAMPTIERGGRLLKFSTVEFVGSKETLEAWVSPFVRLEFGPTSGVSLGNAVIYLNWLNVTCAGREWFVEWSGSGDDLFGHARENTKWGSSPSTTQKHICRTEHLTGAASVGNDYGHVVWVI